MRVFIHFKRFVNRKYNIGALPWCYIFTNKIVFDSNFSSFCTDIVSNVLTKCNYVIRQVFGQFRAFYNSQPVFVNCCTNYSYLCESNYYSVFCFAFCHTHNSIEIRYYRWTREICTRRPISVEVHWPLFSWLKIV